MLYRLKTLALVMGIFSGNSATGGELAAIGPFIISSLTGLPCGANMPAIVTANSKSDFAKNTSELLESVAMAGQALLATCPVLSTLDVSAEAEFAWLFKGTANKSDDWRLSITEGYLKGQSLSGQIVTAITKTPTPALPFAQPVNPTPTVPRPSPPVPNPGPVTPSPNPTTTGTADPFAQFRNSTGGGSGSVITNPRPTGSGRFDPAIMKRPEYVKHLSDRNFSALNSDWFHVMHYVVAFNELLGGQGAFYDQSNNAACTQAANPQLRVELITDITRELGLSPGGGGGDLGGIFNVILGKVDEFSRDPAKLLTYGTKLEAVKEEGRLDATIVTKNSMCNDPAFIKFWAGANAFASQLPSNFLR